MENQIKTAGKKAAKKNKPKPIVLRAIGDGFLVTLKLFGTTIFFCRWAVPTNRASDDTRCDWVVRLKNRGIARERLSLTADLLKRAIQDGVTVKKIKGFTAPDKYAHEAPSSAVWIEKTGEGYILKVSDCGRTIIFWASDDELRQLCDMFCRAIELFDNEINNLKS